MLGLKGAQMPARATWACRTGLAGFQEPAWRFGQPPTLLHRRLLALDDCFLLIFFLRRWPNGNCKLVLAHLIFLKSNLTARIFLLISSWLTNHHILPGG
jgi:hypothetical protein